MADFFQTYYIDPIIYNTGYNIVNTATYAIILVAAVILTFKMLKKLDVQIDKNFFFGIMPFIALGSVLRGWEDLLEATKASAVFLETPLRSFILMDAQGVPRNLLLISPVMYVTVFAIALASLVLALAVQRLKKIPYQKTWFAAGLIIIAAVLSQLKFTNFFAMFLMLGIAAGWATAFFAVKKLAIRNKIRAVEKLFTKENQLILSIHMFDASTTFVALQFFPYFEQHVVSGFFISLFGPAAMFILKLAVVPLVLYYMDKDFSQDRQKKNFIKIAILILGLGPGLRNFLRLGMGV